MTDLNVPPRPFQVGDEVVCLTCGKGKVTANYTNTIFSIEVDFIKHTEYYTTNGKFKPTLTNRCLFHADENVKVTGTEPEPVYEWKVTFLSASGDWMLAHGWYKGTDEFITFSKFEADRACELIIKSKRLVQNNTD